MIPLILRLKKAQHKEIARAQDLIVESLYEIFDDAVLHGGTCIWRCYQGNRFSEDVDVYIAKNLIKLNSFFTLLEKKGFIVLKKKIGENGLFSSFEFNRVVVRFEALFKKMHGELKEYETTDGNLISVYTLLPEELIKEKVNAYINRLKIRDLYDVFYLLRYVNNKEKVRGDINKLLKEFKNPIDEKELRILIIDGLAPNVEKMLQYIKRN